ncbi:MAG: transcription antitermination factor NusB [Phototrophicaceae bacterium]
MSDFPDIHNQSDPEDIEALLALPSDKGQERTIARRLALLMLYEMDCSEIHLIGRVMDETFARYQLQSRTRTYAQKLMTGIYHLRYSIDALLENYATDFPFDQIAMIDRNLLRIAFFEAAVVQDVPIGVAVDEAVALAKLYGSESSPRFVNGVLGTIFQEMETILPDLEILRQELFEDDEQ